MSMNTTVRNRQYTTLSKANDTNKLEQLELENEAPQQMQVQCAFNLCFFGVFKGGLCSTVRGLGCRLRACEERPEFRSLGFRGVGV